MKNYHDRNERATQRVLNTFVIPFKSVSQIDDLFLGEERDDEDAVDLTSTVNPRNESVSYTDNEEYKQLTILSFAFLSLTRRTSARRCRHLSLLW